MIDAQVAAAREAHDTASDGEVLLVAGHGACALPTQMASLVATLGRIGELFYGGDARWRVRRLDPSADEDDRPSRPVLRHALSPVGAMAGPRLVLLAGAVVTTVDGPALVCASSLGRYPEDASLPLAWIAEQLARGQSEAAVCILIADAAAEQRRRWLRELTPGGLGLVVVVAGIGDALLAILDGLSGDAVDRATGTVTPRELGQHLARRLPAATIRASASTATLLMPRPVAGPRDTRLSRLFDIARASAMADEDLSGAVLPGRFRIQDELGRGGFGVVYRAHHDLLDRDVAVKVLAIGSEASPESVALCLQEIRCVSRLDHRNVVRVSFADVLGHRRMFFAMELLDGRDLQWTLDHEPPLAPARALDLTHQLLAGLGAAHAAGVVHADIKPANLIVIPPSAAGTDGERLVLVDFGMARLRGAAPVAAHGGTRAYMSPEQARGGHVDLRSDLFAAARVAVAMLTGWDPATGTQAPLQRIEPVEVRQALARALAESPAERFDSADVMSAALRGASLAAAASSTGSRRAFRLAAPFTQSERDDFHGRERDVDVLLDATLFRRLVIYTAPTGTGKTSLLRAGLMPRLAEHGIQAAYLGCHPGLPGDLAGELAEAITAGAGELGKAIDRHARGGGGRLVLLIDQIENALAALPSASNSDVIAEILDQARSARAVDIVVVLSVREEFLARLLDVIHPFEPGAVLRLRPLTPDVARQVITLTLAARRIAIEPALLDALLFDLERTSRNLALRNGWGDAPVVYPPYLQLAGAVLCDALPAGTYTLELDLYLRLGRFGRIHAEHLHRVLGAELSPRRTAMARAVLLALVTAAQLRVARAEAELIAIACAAVRAPAVDNDTPSPTRSDVAEVISFLASRGLLVSVPGAGNEPVWELVHDSLVPRIVEWIAATDRPRHAALELLRDVLRQSLRGTPRLLGVAELRELARHASPADLRALDAEWSGNEPAAGSAAIDGPDNGPATRLVMLSRRAIRARRIATATAATIVIVVVTVLIVRWQSERSKRAHEASLRARDIGRFTLALDAFDWDPAGQRATPVAASELPELTWTLHRPASGDDDLPGPPDPAADLDLTPALWALPAVQSVGVAARGGPAVLVISGRGHRRADGTVERCAPSVIPIRRLPGYAAGGEPPTYPIRVPTCSASRAGMIEIPAGPFLAGGRGDPPSMWAADDLPLETEIDLPHFAIDRTEVTNAAFAAFAAMTGLHGVIMTEYPSTNELHAAGGADYPVSSINWREARAYCRFVGKDLPSLDQWDKALRGGTTIAGVANPAPRRTFAWAGPFTPGAAAVPDMAARRRPFPVDSFPTDTSPYGVVDLTGNVQEWTRSGPPRTGPLDRLLRTGLGRMLSRVPTGRFRTTRGCNWNDLDCGNSETRASFTGLPNQRALDLREFMNGFRCASPTLLMIPATK